MSDTKIRANLRGMTSVLMAQAETHHLRGGIDNPVFVKMLDGTANADERDQFVLAIASDSELCDSYIAAKEMYEDLIQVSNEGASVVEFPTRDTSSNEPDDVYTETILPMAAAEQSQIAVSYDGKAKEWTTKREERPGDSENVMLVFKCVESCIPNYKGSRVTLVVEGEDYFLGVVDRRGIAETKVPATVELTGSFDVKIRPKK